MGHTNRIASILYFFSSLYLYPYSSLSPSPLPSLSFTTNPSYNQFLLLHIFTLQCLILPQPPLPPECGAPSRNGFSCMRPCWPCSLATPDSTSSLELPLTWALANLFSQSTATLLPYSCSFLLPTSWKS